MLNHIVLLGRLTADPEIKYTQNGNPVAMFTLAVDRDFKTAGGDRETDFINITAWKNTAEFVGKYFTKGRAAVVSGRLQIRRYEDKEGHKRTASEVVADNVYFADSKNATSQSETLKSSGYNAAPAPAYQQPSNNGFPAFDGMADNDNVPF